MSDNNKPDMVNHPPHYKTGGIEAIDYMKAKMEPAEFIGYLRGNIFKYNTRIGLKGDPVEDSGKIAWYAIELNKYMIYLKEQNK